MTATKPKANWLDVKFDEPWKPASAILRSGNSLSLDKRLSYYKEPGMISMSYSRLRTLHTCARKFQLLEKQERQAKEPSIHTAYGHAFGAGVQALWRTQSLAIAFFEAMCAWDYPDLDVREDDVKGQKDVSANKTFWDCLTAIQTYYHGLFQEHFDEYEIANLPDGKRAIELFFVIRIGEKYTYQGHIDLVLQHRKTKQYCVFEIKTSQKDFYPSLWANSDQTLGYNVVMDFVGQREAVGNEYKVIYLCYQTKLEEFTPMEFTKSKKTKANFITTILLNVKTLELYEEWDFYPKNGDSCHTGYGKNCQFFGTCDLEHMTHAPAGSDVYATASVEDVDYFIDVQDLLGTQEKLLDDTIDSGVNFDTLHNGEEDA
jgi:hypothetical protein